MTRSHSILAGLALTAACMLAGCSHGAPGGAGTTTGAGRVGTATGSYSRAITPTTTELPAGRGGSAHVRSSWVVEGANLSLEYGRPALKGRPESQMMPVGMPWRTGADAATILTTDRALTFGAVTLQPGTYTINTQPGEGSWQLILGRLKAPGQWGVPYLPELEIGRVPMTVARAQSPVELVTISIDPAPGGGVLRIEWGTTSVSAPFTVAKQ